ncbi:CaiB/BaiF CoA transferase family protein, partial [Thermodesulfobacteriota bacterium]
GDLGADVIKVEKPGGDPVRRIGPFYHDTPEPEKSLYWFALNTSKRGITLDIETTDGQAIFKRLVETADIVIESFDPGYMDKLNLGYPALSQINQKIIMTSITGFGQTGPYKDLKASDFVVWALSGVLYIVGDPDRPPLAPGFPQAFLFGAMQATVGTMVALFHSHITGHGQHVDASALLASSLLTQPDVQGVWDLERKITPRLGRMRLRPGTLVRTPLLWQCKDGEVSYIIMLGPATAHSNFLLAEWVDSEGMSSETFRNINWKKIGWDEMTQELADEVIEVLSKFFMKHTKAELFEGATKRSILLSPTLTPKDLLEFEHLAARNYWIELEHPELDAIISYPGGFVRSTETSCGISRRAPGIGEHNEEIYLNELGLSKKELVTLKQNKVI